MREVIFGTVLTMAMVVGACGGSEPQSATGTDAPTETVTTEATPQQAEAAPTAQSPCAALSAAEVSTLTGLSLTAHAGDTEKDCSYRTADDQVKLTVKIVDAAGFDAVAMMKGAESVPNLGDRATWNDAFDSLLAVKGDRMLDVAYDESPEVTTRATPAEKKQRVIALAEKLLPTI